MYSENRRLLILYYSKTGHTLEAVDAMAEGIQSSGSEPVLISATDFIAESILDFDGLIVASPCWAGSITSNGVAKQVGKAIDSLPVDSLKGKRCGGISVHAKTGGETTIASLGRLLCGKGCEEFCPGPSAKAGVPFSLWKGPSVSSTDEDAFKRFGAEFATQEVAVL